MIEEGWEAQEKYEITFTETDFHRIARLAKVEFGLNLTASKKQLVYSRLAKHLRYKRYNSFHEYLNFIESTLGEHEKLEFISSLTTNITHFFREPHHFDFFSSTIVPKLAEKIAKGDRVRIWSAGCSSGQEPYSIALLLNLHLKSLEKSDIKILATDIDTKILSVAKEAQFDKNQLAQIPHHLHYLLDLGNEQCRTFSIGKSTRDLVTFAPLNLISEWPMKRKFDVIFCRNVSIYFDNETQEIIWRKIESSLSCSGFLFIGHSERIQGTAKRNFQNAGVTIYQHSPTVINKIINQESK